jgi:MFS family permease
MIEDDRASQEIARSSVGDPELPVVGAGKNGSSSTTAAFRLLFFFAIVYAIEGFCEPGGLIGQPLLRLFKESYGWDTTRISASMSCFSIPWMIKPLYGIVSDSFPILGRRRRPYLIIANIMATLAYLVVSLILDSRLLFDALIVVFFGMAISSTVCGALLVENGQRLKIAHSLVTQQWLWLGIAGIFASALGGWLTQHYRPVIAVHVTVLLLSLLPLTIILACNSLIDDWPVNPKSQTTGLRFIGTMRSIWSRSYIIVAFFLFLYMFSPGFNVPLYFQMTDKLHFTQDFIGYLNSIGSLGSVIGALLYGLAFRGLAIKRTLNVSILLGVIATLSYLFMKGPASAIALFFFNGATGTVFLITSVTLAVQFCPRESEGFGFALLASVANLSMRLSDIAGSFLYDHALGQRLAPLLWISAGFTALAFLFVPFLGLKQSPKDRLWSA